MASSMLDGDAFVEEGFDLADAWNLETPPVPERQIDKLLVQIGDDLFDLEKLASDSGAESTAEAVKKYRKYLVELAKQAGKNKKESKLVDEAVKLLLLIRAELSVPAREEGFNKALATFKTHVRKDDPRRRHRDPLHQDRTQRVGGGLAPGQDAGRVRVPVRGEVGRWWEGRFTSIPTSARGRGSGFACAGQTAYEGRHAKSLDRGVDCGSGTDHGVRHPTEWGGVRPQEGDL